MRVLTGIWAVVAFFAQGAQAGEWKSYTCLPVEDAYADGDSFHGKADTNYTYIWRLYGADCPETDSTIPERVKEQAAYFRVDEATVIRYGKKASAFTVKFLDKGFVAHTQKQKARGQSKKNRYYAHVMARGQCLASALVENGLARAYGYFEAFPENGHRDEKSFERHLKSLEGKARRAKIGIWAE